MRNFLLLAVILLAILAVTLFTFNRSIDSKYKDAVLNLKASQLELSGSKDEVAAYKLISNFLSNLQLGKLCVTFAETL